MGVVRVTCPHCGYWRDVAREAVPAGTVRVSCPRCRQSFTLENVAGVLPSAAEELPVPPGESSPPEAEETAQTRQPLPEDGAEQPHEPPVTPITPPEGTPPGRLSGIGELFGRSWEIYKNRAVTLISLYFLAMISFAVPVGLFLGAGYLLSARAPESRAILLAGGGLAGAIVGSVALFWGLGAMVCAVADTALGIREALERGWERFIAFSWLYFLSGFIVVGGYLFCVVPGVIFTVWFIFAQFIVADGKGRGMAALLASREYVRGYWFDVFARLIMIWLFSVAVGWVPLAGPLLSLLAVPFSMIFTWLIYADLQEVKGGAVPSPATGEKAAWLVVAFLGYLLLPFVIIATIGASLLQLFLSP